MGSYCLMDRVSVWDDEKVLEMESVMVAHQYECLMLMNYTLKKMINVVNFMVCIFYHNFFKCLQKTKHSQS